jgi:glycosyltransferase involved in cell wall biosynthesis
MVKILLLVGNYLPGFKSGGALRSTVNMVDRLGDEFEFWIITSDRDSGDEDAYSNIILKKWNLIGNAKVYYVSPEERSIASITNIINNTEHDILYLNSFFDPIFTIFPLLSRRIGKLKSRPTILASRGEFAKGALSLKKWKKFGYLLIAKIFGLYRNILWQASSEFEANDISKIMKRFEPEIVTAPNIPKYLNSLNHNDIKTRDLSEPLKICFLGRISPVKNLDYALRVLSKVKKPVLFNIYGPIEDNHYWNECLNIIKLLPSYIRVNYKGSIENIAVTSMLSKHDLFFLPTKGENFGHVILESMSSGTPILISNTTPWRNLEKFGVGWDISLKSPDAFTAAIEKAASINQNDFKKLRITVREYAEKFTNDDSILYRTRKLFMNALGRKNA